MRRAADVEKPVRILHVEDSPTDADLVQHALRAAGIDASLTVVDSADAVAKHLEGPPPDLILSDFTLPGFSGEGALRIAQQQAPQVPVIIVSATVGEEQAVELLKAGATDYVMKDRLERLGPAVRRALDDAAAAEQRRRLERDVAAANAATAEALALLDTLQGNAPIGFGYVDGDGVVVRMNDALAATVGVPAAEQIGRPVRDVVPHVWPRLEPVYERARHGRPTLNVEVTEAGVDPDGARSWVLSAYPVVVDQASPGVGIVALEITEQKRAAERFRTVVDSMLDALYLLSPIGDGDGTVIDFCIDHANPAGLQLMQGTFDEVVGHRLLELAPAATDLVASYARVLDTGESMRREHVYEGPLPGSTNARVAFDLSAVGHRSGLIIACRDIGPRRAAEEAMRRSEARFRSLIQNSSDIVLLVDPAATVQYVSPAAQRLLGYSPEEMQGTSALDLIHPEDLEFVASTLAAAVSASGIAKPIRYRARHADGRWRWLESIGNNLLDEPSVGAVVINARDVTEEALVVQDLLATQELLAGITDNMAEGMVAIDRAGAFTFVNAAAERLLGWPASELIGRTSADIVQCAPPGTSFDDATDCPLAIVIRRGEPCRVERQEFLRRDGTTFPVAYSASPLVTDGVTGAVIVFDDISERLAEQSRIDRELDKLAWVGRIRDALDQDRFVLYAQPIIDLVTGEAIQHELLLRMLTADGEVVLPDAFLPTAEEFGLISEIDRWVITETARLAGLGHPVEFNLSTKSVVDPNMVAFIRAALESSGADPGNVVCEITETALLNDAQAGEAFVEGLNAIGCRVALDDFGMGYGGFAYLKRLPVSCLKIDREFVQDLHEVPASRHVVSAVVSLARAFSLQTVAEGAEDVAVLDVLRELGVDFVQGYATGRPAPLAEAFATEQPGPRQRSMVARIAVTG